MFDSVENAGTIVSCDEDYKRDVLLGSFLTCGPDVDEVSTRQIRGKAVAAKSGLHFQ
jgi:hypothetical protein